MEVHRLQPMKEGYSVELFNRLYKETTPLRKKLTSQIDPRYYGVSRDIIESWFDDKFIFVFNKYFEEKEPEVLKGYIINALQTFKYRVLRKAYSREGNFYGSNIRLEGESELINIIPDTSTHTTEDVFYGLAMGFMEEKLSENAFILFQAQLTPPPYILSRIKSSNSRIPYHLLAEFLGIDLGDEISTEKYIKNLRREINKTIAEAKEYFSSSSFSFPL